MSSAGPPGGGQGGPGAPTTRQLRPRAASSRLQGRLEDRHVLDELLEGGGSERVLDVQVRSCAPCAVPTLLQCLVCRNSKGLRAA